MQGRQSPATKTNIMRILLLSIFLMIGHYGFSQRAESGTDVTSKARYHSERIGTQFRLEKSKVNKLYWIDKQLEEDRAKVPTQFQDSLGRALAYGRLERRRDEQYANVLTREQYKEYRQGKKKLAQ